jgi:hypothetical protein
VKQKFAAPQSVVVKLQHGEEVVEIRLEAPPFGLSQRLAQLYPPPPAPIRYVNGQAEPQPKGSKEYAAWEAEVSDHSGRSGDILLAMAMGDAMETPPPVLAPGTDFGAYVAAVRAEWDAAHLHTGDRIKLIRAYNAVQGLGGEQGKD